MLAQRAAAAAFIRLLVVTIMLAAGLSAVTLATSASPAQANDRYTIDLPASGGGNPTDGGSTGWNPGSGGASGGVGVSLYKVRSKWDDRVDLAKRNVPSPMGFYTSDRFNTTIVRGGGSVALRNAIGWTWQGSPCKATGKNVGGITVYPSGMDWTQRVRWIRDGNWYGMSESAYNNLDRCVNEATYSTITRVCPVKAYDSTLTGPYSTPGNPLPAAERGGSPRDVPLSSAPSVPLNPTETNGLVVREESGKSVAYTSFGDLFSDKARWDALPNALKIREASICPPLRSMYEMPNVAASQAAQTMGNYKARTTGVSVECRWNVTRPYEMAYTNPDSTGVGSFAAWTQTYGAGDGYRGISWQGCNPVTTTQQELTKNVTCEVQSGVGRFAVRNGIGSDFVGNFSRCTGSEWDNFETSMEAQCTVPAGRSAPTLTTLGGLPGEQTTAGNGTTVMADGKVVQITWPDSVPTGPLADRVTNWQTTYRMTGGGYPASATGLRPNDPFKSNVSLKGGSAPSNVPLTLQFYKAGGVVTNPNDQSGTPQMVRIDAERTFTFTKMVRTYRINLATNEVVFTGETPQEVKTAEPCRYSAEFYVATVRNSN